MKKIGYVIVSFSLRIILTIIYFLLLWLLAVVVKSSKLFKKKKVNTNWEEIIPYKRILFEKGRQ